MKVLVLGASSYHSGLIEDLSKGGCEITLMDRRIDHPLSNSVDEIVLEDFSVATRLRATIRAHAGVVLALNDFAVKALVEADAWDASEFRAGYDKLEMRRKWARNGVAQPRSHAFSKHTEIPSLPLIVKPNFSGGGGRGVSLVTSDEDFLSAVTRAEALSLDGTALVEEYVEGTEFTVETISWKGRHIILCASSKEKVPGYPWIARGLTFGSPETRELRSKIELTAQAALDALNRIDGISHLEMIREVATGDLKVIEIGFRPGGGHILSPIVSTLIGENLAMTYARLVAHSFCEVDWENVQDGVSDFWRSQRCIHYGFFDPPKGLLVSISGLREFRAQAGVLSAEVVAAPGTVVKPWKDSLGRVGHFVVEGDSYEQLLLRVAGAQRSIRFEMSDVT